MALAPCNSTMLPPTFYITSCAPVECPVHSSGIDVVTGCACDAGYTGAVAPISSYPFYSYFHPYFESSCAAVSCPANSAGPSVPLGCLCNAGFSGTVVATSTSPFYNSSCAAGQQAFHSHCFCTPIVLSTETSSPETGRF